MAKQLASNTDSGIALPDAYWTVAFFAVDQLSQQIRVMWYGWADKTAHDAGKPPVPGLQKEYIITGQEFGQVIAPVYAGVKKALYDYAVATKDVGPMPAPGQPDTRTSFFDGSVDV